MKIHPEIKRTGRRVAHVGLMLGVVHYVRHLSWEAFDALMAVAHLPKPQYVFEKLHSLRYGWLIVLVAVTLLLSERFVGKGE